MAGEPSPAHVEPSEKKPYHPPQLEEYGDIREITQSVGMTGSDDNGRGSMTRTG